MILAQTLSGTTIAPDAAALRGQIADTGTYGIGVYGVHAGQGIGVQGETARAGIGVRGKSSGGGTGVQATCSGSGFGVFASSDTGIAVLGSSSTSSSSVFSVGDGVFGASESGSAIHGQAGSGNSAGGGYGGDFEIIGTGLAQLLLRPSGSGG